MDLPYWALDLCICGTPIFLLRDWFDKNLLAFKRDIQEDSL